MVASSEPTEHVASDSAQQQDGPSFSHIVEDLKRSAAEFAEYAKYLIALEVDNATLMAKKAAIFAALGVIGLVVFLGILAVSTGLLMVGIAGLIGSALGSFWLGATIVGLLVLLLTGIGGAIGIRYFNTQAYKKLRLKYADRRQRQKEMFGRDIREVANG